MNSLRAFVGLAAVTFAGGVQAFDRLQIAVADQRLGQGPSGIVGERAGVVPELSGRERIHRRQRMGEKVFDRAATAGGIRVI